jgi:CSLREA domain-containing protein
MVPSGKSAEIRMSSACLRLAWVGLLACASARAAVFAVDTTGDTVDTNPGDGLCADANGACSLRAAVMEANALEGADVIELPAGDFVRTIAGSDEDLSATGDLDIDADVTIEGAGVDATSIDAAALDRVFDLLAGTGPHEVRFERLTIRNGLRSASGSDGGGSGLRVAAGVHVLLQDVVIRDNRSTLAVGGIAIDTQGCVEGQRVRILDNVDTAQTGSGNATAAVYLHGESDVDIGACFMLEDGEISGNRADQAGAVQGEFAPLTLKRTLVSDNEARFAGALVLNFDVDALIENTTISGNRGNPGALLNDGGSMLVLVNSTITRNGASQGTTNVGGIQDVHGGFGLTFLSNTIVSGNGPGFSADDCDRATSVGGGNIVGDSARCHFDADPSDQLDVDPGLGDLADNGGFTRTHLPGAAAIDHASAAACPADDQRGLPRPVDGDGDGEAACDIGSVEIALDDAIYADGFDG